MLQNYPKLRFGIYLIGVLATIVSIILDPTGSPFAEAIANVSDYLMLVAGTTAALNTTDLVPPRGTEGVLISDDPPHDDLDGAGQQAPTDPSAAARHASF